MESSFLFVLLLFAIMILLILGIYFLFISRREIRGVKERVKRIMDEEPSRIEEGKPPFLSDFAWGRHLLSLLLSLGGVLTPKKEGELSHLRKSFMQAGYRGENAPVFFFGVKGLLAILFFAIFSLLKLSLLVLMPQFQFMVYAIGVALAGFYLPNLWLWMKINKRKRDILIGFPDALDVMVVCMEAGVGLDAAINRVGEEMKLSNKTLSEEFKLLNLELRAGKLRRDALRSLASRTGLEDINSWATLLIQTDKFGTSMAQALRVHSDSMRTRRQQRAEELAAKIPTKLIFPMILFIFPSLFVALIGPAIIKILRVLFPVMSGQ